MQTKGVREVKIIDDLQDLKERMESDDCVTYSEDVILLGNVIERLKSKTVLPLVVGKKYYDSGSYTETDGSTRYYLDELIFIGFVDERFNGGELKYYVLYENGFIDDMSPDELCLTKSEAIQRIKLLRELEK